MLIIVGVCGGVGDEMQSGDVGRAGSWLTDSMHKHSHTVCNSPGGVEYHVASDNSRNDIYSSKSRKKLLLVS